MQLWRRTISIALAGVAALIVNASLGTAQPPQVVGTKFEVSFPPFRALGSNHRTCLRNDLKEQYRHSPGIQIS
jgi:hypothetical protein